MLKLLKYSKDIRIQDADYIFEDISKLKHVLPYMKRKIDGEWSIALVLFSIKEMREILGSDIIPKYVEATCYLDGGVVSQLIAEHPDLNVKVRNNYEKYMDLLADSKIDIDQSAATELYRRVGAHKDKLQEYLYDLRDKAEGSRVTVDLVKIHIADERKTYASSVMMDFLSGARWRWKSYNSLVEDLGNDYAFYALRKFVGKLVVEKNKYLRNESTDIRGIDKVDSFSINRAYILFNTFLPKELCICMAMLDNKEYMRRYYVSSE